MASLKLFIGAMSTSTSNTRDVTMSYEAQMSNREGTTSLAAQI